jgi:hypothetical protein
MPACLAFVAVRPVEEGTVYGLDPWLEPQVRASGYSGCHRADGHRHRSAAVRPGRCLPRVHAPVGGDPDRGAWPVRGRGGAADYRAARAGPAQRRSVAGPHSLLVDARPVGHRPDVRAGHKPLRRAADGPGADDPGARPAQRGQPADHDPADRLGQPGGHDQAVVPAGVAHRHVRARAVEDPAAADGCARSRERVDLRPARPAAPGPGRPEPAASPACVAGAGHRDRGQRAVGVAADVRGGVDARHRGFLRVRQPAPLRAAHLPDIHAAAAFRRARRGREGRKAQAGRRGERDRGPSAPDR